MRYLENVEALRRGKDKIKSEITRNAKCNSRTVLSTFSAATAARSTLYSTSSMDGIPCTKSEIKPSPIQALTPFGPYIAAL